MSGKLLLCGCRIVVPELLQKETLSRIHHGNQRIQRSCLRAQSSAWWPGMSKEVTEYVRNCHVCAQDANPSKKPLIPAKLPTYPWQRVATDLFFAQWNNVYPHSYYFSQLLEVIKLSTITSSSVILAMKSVFSRHGIPKVVNSDNGPQYSSEELRSLLLLMDSSTNRAAFTFLRVMVMLNGQSKR